MEVATMPSSHFTPAGLHRQVPPTHCPTCECPLIRGYCAYCDVVRRRLEHDVSALTKKVATLEAELGSMYILMYGIYTDGWA